MLNYGTHQERTIFEDYLYAIVDEYLTNMAAYPEDCSLFISDKTMEAEILDTASTLDNADKYSVSKLIRINDLGEREVETDELSEISSNYFFIR